MPQETRGSQRLKEEEAEAEAEGAAVAGVVEAGALPFPCPEARGAVRGAAVAVAAAAAVAGAAAAGAAAAGAEGAREGRDGGGTGEAAAAAAAGGAAGLCLFACCSSPASLSMVFPSIASLLGGFALLFFSSILEGTSKTLLRRPRGREAEREREGERAGVGEKSLFRSLRRRKRGGK